MNLKMSNMDVCIYWDNGNQYANKNNCGLHFYYNKTMVNFRKGTFVKH